MLHKLITFQSHLPLSPVSFPMELSYNLGAAVVFWLNSWLAEQEVWSSIPGLAATISEIGYVLLSSRYMAERSLKRRKSSKQPTNQFLYVGMLTEDEGYFGQLYPIHWGFAELCACKKSKFMYYCLSILFF